MGRIIALTGLAGSGKDTTADYIISKEKGWRKLAFADQLKDVTALLFNLDREMLAGTTPEARASRETPNEFWSKKLGQPTTPRMLLQKLGTDVLRNHFYRDIWVACLEQKLEQTEGNVIITDVRFPNEIKMLKDRGAVFIRLERNAPEWCDEIEECNRFGKKRSLSLQLILEGVHESEYAWIGLDEPSYILDNDGTIEDLYKQINEVLK